MLKLEKSQEPINTKYEIPYTACEQAIFATIAYYDYFNYPLTASEVYQYLIKPNSQCHPEFISGSIKTEKRNRVKILKRVQNDNLKVQDDKIKRDLKPNFSEIIKTLDESESLKKLISQKNGFYFLAGCEEIIASRIQRKKLTDQKLKKSKWILKFLSYLPFTRLVMISGSMSIGNPREESDIDLLIVVKAGRIWTARAIITFFALIFGKYRHIGKTQNRLCLNHYITDKSLLIDLNSLYEAEEYLNLLPIAGEMKIYNEFFDANRSWLEHYVYLNSEKQFGDNLQHIFTNSVLEKIKYFLEYLLSGFGGNYLEKKLKDLQIFFIKNNPLTSQLESHCPVGKSNAPEANGPSSMIRYTDDNLVFHPVLKGLEAIKKYEEKLAELDANLS